VGHVVAPEPTSVGRCGLKLQLTWQHVDAHPASCLNLELICGGIRSSEYRQKDVTMKEFGGLGVPDLRELNLCLV
jgi:hypothetical protein